MLHDADIAGSCRSCLKSWRCKCKNYSISERSAVSLEAAGLSIPRRCTATLPRACSPSLSMSQAVADGCALSAKRLYKPWSKGGPRNEALNQTLQGSPGQRPISGGRYQEVSSESNRRSEGGLSRSSCQRHQVREGA